MGTVSLEGMPFRKEGGMLFHNACNDLLTVRMIDGQRTLYCRTCDQTVPGLEELQKLERKAPTEPVRAPVKAAVAEQPKNPLLREKGGENQDDSGKDEKRVRRGRPRQGEGLDRAAIAAKMLDMVESEGCMKRKDLMDRISREAKCSLTTVDKLLNLIADKLLFVGYEDFDKYGIVESDRRMMYLVVKGRASETAEGQSPEAPAPSRAASAEEPRQARARTSRTRTDEIATEILDAVRSNGGYMKKLELIRKFTLAGVCSEGTVFNRLCALDDKLLVASYMDLEGWGIAHADGMALHNRRAYYVVLKELIPQGQHGSDLDKRILDLVEISGPIRRGTLLEQVVKAENCHQGTAEQLITRLVEASLLVKVRHEDFRKFGIRDSDHRAVYLVTKERASAELHVDGADLDIKMLNLVKLDGHVRCRDILKRIAVQEGCSWPTAKKALNRLTDKSLLVKVSYEDFKKYGIEDSDRRATYYIAMEGHAQSEMSEGG